jgi:hypothetical protein
MLHVRLQQLVGCATATALLLGGCVLAAKKQ